MRRFAFGCAAVLMAAALVGAAEKGMEREKKSSEAAAGLDKLKTLLGEWEAKLDDGSTARASYKVVSAGSCVLETLNPHGADDVDMVTVYHLDGDRVMLTHFCAANNQPRMRAEPPPGDIKKLSFEFVDATNLSSPNEGHMHSLVLTFVDDQHFTQDWTYYENGKPTDTATFRFHRK
ncbi:MAG: hypothetical protein V2A79_19775 [Planctomycetota bacterium]